MLFVGVHFIVDLLLVLIFGVLVTLFEGALARPMKVARLEGLVLALGGTLVVLFVIACVVILATVAVVAILVLVISTLCVIASTATMIFTLIVMLCVIAQLLLVALLERVSEFVFCAIFNLPLTLPCKQAVSHL